MPPVHTVQLASVRVLTEDLPRQVRFYEAVTGATARWLTDDFVELVTPSATVALSHPRRVAFISENTPRAAANDSAIVEFLVDDVDALFARLQQEFDDDLVVVQPPTTMPWGNRSALLRDPDGALVNLYTPVTAQGLRLQQQRQPQLLQPALDAERSVEELAIVFEGYLAAFAAASAADRERLLRHSVAEDVTFSNPGVEGCGLDDLLEHVAVFREQLPGAHFRLDWLRPQHSQLLAHWTTVDRDGADFVAGCSYARVDQHGRLTHIAGFWAPGAV